MMKNIFLLALIAGIVGCSLEVDEGVKLSGNLEQFPSGGFAFIEVVGENGIERFDTLNVDENGYFSEYLTIRKPAFYRINFNGRQIITLILTGKEADVVVNAHGNDPRGFSEISGSYDTEYKNQIDAIMQDYRQQIQRIQQIQRQTRADNDAQAFQTAQLQMMDLA